MTFPLLFTVGHHVWSAGTENANGNTTDVYTPAKGSAGTQVKVYGWSTPVTSEPRIAGHDRTIVEVEMLAPPGFVVSPRDLIDLPQGPSGQFEVIGYDEDYNNGPFGWHPGTVVNLRRVDG